MTLLIYSHKLASNISMKEFTGISPEPDTQTDPFIAVSEPHLQDYLRKADQVYTTINWPHRVSHIDNKSLVTAFGMERGGEMVEYMKAIRKAGVLVPQEVEMKTAYGQVRKMTVVTREQMQAAAAMYWVVQPELKGTVREKFKKVNWQEAYDSTMEQIEECDFAYSLRDPSTLPDEEEMRSANEKIVFENTRYKEPEKKKPLTDTSSWDTTQLESALGSLEDFEDVEEVIPENVLYWMMQLTYPGSTRWTSDQVKGSIEKVMRAINTDATVENLHELILKVQDLQRQRSST